MNEFFMWIYEGIGILLGLALTYVGLPVLAILVFACLWPYISGVVKVFAYGIPAVTALVLFLSGETGDAILMVGVTVVCFFGLRLLFRFFDNKFGVLMEKEEAERAWRGSI